MTAIPPSEGYRVDFGPAAPFLADNDKFTAENFEQAQRNIQTLIALTSQRAGDGALKVSLSYDKNEGTRVSFDENGVPRQKRNMVESSFAFSEAELRQLSSCTNYRQLHYAIGEMIETRARQLPRRFVGQYPIGAQAASLVLRELAAMDLDQAALLAEQRQRPTLTISISPSAAAIPAWTAQMNLLFEVVDKLAKTTGATQQQVTKSIDVTPTQTTLGALSKPVR